MSVDASQGRLTARAESWLDLPDVVVIVETIVVVAWPVVVFLLVDGSIVDFWIAVVDFEVVVRDGVVVVEV